LHFSHHPGNIPAYVPSFRSKNGTLLLNHQNFSNIELAKLTNMTVPELMETVEAENSAQVFNIT